MTSAAPLRRGEQLERTTLRRHAAHAQARRVDSLQNRHRPLPALREALAAVDRKLWKELEAAGVERIDPTGEPFDPGSQEAVSIAAPPEPSKDHTVAATFQTGYRVKGVLVRPARVQVYSSQGVA